MLIGFVVVEGETKENWTWFLELLINYLGGRTQCRTHTFIYDQQMVILIDDLIIHVISCLLIF